MQISILTLLKKHILMNKLNPISTMCELFKEAFKDAYKQYSVTLGTYESKLEVIQNFEAKTTQLQRAYIS
jgi:predicted DNA-binding protein YlxM (UPF0122 family)